MSDDMRGDEESIVEDLLWRFEQECPVPTRSDVERWCRENPSHEREILGYVAAKLELVLSPAPADDVEGQVRRETKRPLTRSGIDVTRVIKPREEDPDLAALFERAHTSVRQLAADLDIKDTLLLRMVTGQVAGAMPTQIAHDMASRLNVAPLDVVAAANQSRARPRHGHASADDAPGREVPTYDQLIEGGDMSDERKGYWLRDP